MALYIVVHHKGDPSQPWPNNWLDDQRLQAIETTAEIGRLCQEARQERTRVYVHRCRWGDNPPTICCSVSVQRVSSINRRTSLVEFNDIEVSTGNPPEHQLPGQNFYNA